MLFWPIFPVDPRPSFYGRRDRETGVALILVTMAVFLLTLAVLGTKSGVDLAEEIVISTAEETRAFYLARSGLALVRAVLEEDEGDVDSYEEDWAAANTVGAIPIADVGWVVGQVSDEEGKFNVLDLVNDNGETDENTDAAALRLQDLLEILGLPRSRALEIVDSLVDWMDFDGTVTGTGAEDSYYRSLSPPYPCANAVPRALEDLGLVKGIGRVLLYSGEGEVPALEKFLTVHGDKKAGDKFRRVNLNTAPAEVLMALSPEIDEKLAQEIVESRQDQPFESPAEIKDVPGFPGDEFYSNELAVLIDVSSSYFAATIRGETTVASARVYGVFHRKEGSIDLVYYRGF